MGRSQRNRSSTTKSTWRNTCNINVTFSTTLATLRKILTTCSKKSTEVPAAHNFSNDILVTSLGCKWAPSVMSSIPVLFNFLIEKIMQETIQDHHTHISIVGRQISL
ncbi:hypothetical protein DPMN_075329 [Dreissena polymorpha]|uniref:Uncharacterized protein n=1 Tax=Dreissena polymorpha TaxID=45954 RepID=A0A9D4BME7_DREPO|nr:hypothetical protein DPMN_075329 [Dreissena polymorpha]